MYDHDYFPFFGMPYGLGWVFMILFWLFVVAVGIAILRWLVGGAMRQKPDVSAPPAPKAAADILRERYARGDIEREEFLRRLDDLNRY